MHFGFKELDRYPVSKGYLYFKNKNVIFNILLIFITFNLQFHNK